MSRPRACLIRHGDKVESPLLRESEALTQAGFDVDVVLMRPPTDSHRAELPDHVRILTIPVRRRKGGAAAYLVDYASFVIPAAVLVLWQHLRRPYQVVQVASLPDVLVLAGLLPRALGAALVMKVAEPTPQLSETLGQPVPMRRLLGRLQIWAARRADVVYTVTEDLARDLASRGVDPDRIVVVLNVPPLAMAALATGEDRDARRFTVVCHGTIEERYGHDTVLRAAAQLRDRIPGLEIRFTGSGPYRAVLEDLVSELGLEDVVQHHDWLPWPEVVRLVETSDVGVVAQKASPYSNLVHTNKMFEFLLLGVPAVCSRLAATERLFPPEAGVVRYFEPDDADSLARVLEDLHDRPAERERMASAGRAAFEALGPAQRAAYVAAIGKAVERRRAAGRTAPIPVRRPDDGSRGPDRAVVETGDHR